MRYSFKILLFLFLAVIIAGLVSVSVYYAILMSPPIHPASQVNTWIETNHGLDENTDYEIPRIIWCYWNSDKLADTPKAITDKWKDLLGSKGWDIRIVTPGNTSQYVLEEDMPLEKFNALIVQARSDWIRLYLLKKYGGVWSDITNIYNNAEAFENLVKQTGLHRADIGGFYLQDFQTNKRFCVVESWWLVSPKNSPFIARLFDEFNKAVNMGFKEYKQLLKSLNVDFQKLFKDEEDVYLMIHACMQYILQSEPNRYNLYLVKAEDTMYRLHDICKWDLICINFRKSEESVLNLPFVKLRNIDRTWGKPFYGA